MIKNLDKKRIGIIRGGIGKNYVNSLIKGGDIILHILENLEEKYKVADILVDKGNVWHLNGLPIKSTDLENKVDLIWDVLQHPSFSPILENLNIPKINNELLAAISENNKDFLREEMQKIKIRVPKSLVLPLYQKDFDGDEKKYAFKKAKEIHEKFSPPWIVKSFTPDSSMGVHLAKTFTELVNAILDGVAHHKSILIEEFISGKIISIHSVSGFRNQDAYIFHSMDNLLKTEKEKLTELVQKVHKYLKINHYLKSDFIIHKNRGVFLINLEFLPDLKNGSHFEKICEAVGVKKHNIIEHILEKALNKNL